ncbi:MAG: hypothetical protein ACT4PW_06690 [Acidimicrobiia bacterium]
MSTGPAIVQRRPRRAGSTRRPPAPVEMPVLEQAAGPGADAVVALVNGTGPSIAGLTAAFAGAGFDPWLVPERTDLAEACRSLAGHRVGCYVQLPVTVACAAAASVGELRSLVNDGLLARLDALAAIAPALSAGSAVVIVTGDQVGRFFDHDLGLSEILERSAPAILADHGNGEVSTAVIGPDRSPVELSALAVRMHQNVAPDPRSWAAYAPELDFSEWRSELIGFGHAVG